ncbi:hypothetical protein AOX59_01850 [Lentibacillus amyloliquefaciens]|uniref:Uncharacterized protein n=1 Tax=Lentibacillus amyloliquefaciens TaxID=1472767 RepID=A0A0U4E2G1_9BACI|nr:hypothetical protein AOX59_01850 [Lentibacillus amyloliquefaciens]
MNVWNLSGNRITPSAIFNSSQLLRPGQIIQGNIVKIYPDQKAQIQLGTHKMTAQLETSLTVSARYHFQVQPSDDVGSSVNSCFHN